ncbi:DEAD/DEAH box helicase family protein [Mesorhizobium sp. M1143]|uniref:DEAD/DEAH box helicase family protein n=1 Tax=Mesorhizobium sp. M1143 TaxID=2957061 RepID=UPI0033379ED6
MAHDENCPFCSVDPERLAFQNEFLIAVWDRFPVSDGHMLIVPKRHAEGWEDLDQSEKTALISAVDQAINLIRSSYGTDGFNVGFNHGAAAGQTVFHFHLHVIPRRSGDVADPRGGVRHVIPAKGNYLAKRQTSTVSDDEQRLVTGGEDPLLPHLVRYLDSAEKCEIAVSFLLDSGARLIAHHLADFLVRGGQAEILVGDYLDVTDPIALRRLSDLEGDLTLRIYQSAIGRGFHLKSYSFLAGAEGVAFVGSSNLSEPALTHSIEWNYKIVSSHDTAGFSEIRAAFANLFNSPVSTRVSQEWIDAYERRRTVPSLNGPSIPDADVELEKPFPIPFPHEIQQQALQALERTREDGYSAGLVVLATGLGKTWLAAFDSNRSQFARVLFIAHRDEILTQAIETFRRIRPEARIGRMTGEVREIDADLVFASIQTLGRINHLSRFQRTDFDYVVVDEFHHAAAGTYRRVIEYFEPKFLLGLTATPERADGADLLALCQENEVFNANVHDGINLGRLCPFHYFGVPDDIDYSNIPWRSVRFDPEALDAAVATDARARNALEQFQSKGGRRCIGFCCSQRHADFMARFFVSAGLRAVAVHAGPSSAPRTTSLKQLAIGEIDVIFAVDMFNEGVDVPAIDTVMMLRPTESTVIWMQQLGRGLRVAEDKQYLTVIDYIGNHRSFLMKLRAMAALISRSAESKGHLREVLEEIRRETISLPPGCEVTYDLSAVDILQQLLRPSGVESALESFYRDFEERHGLRPNAVEAFHAGLNPRSNSEGSWLGFVDRMGGLAPEEQSVFETARDFFVAMEKTETTRSYKIVLLQAMFEGSQLNRQVAVDELARRVAAQVGRVHRLAEDFSVDLDDLSAVQRLLVQNPIEAFVNAQGTGGPSFVSKAANSRLFLLLLTSPALEFSYVKCSTGALRNT